MSRCLELAAHGRGNVAPNPMVGAVIVADGKIIGEGFHRCFGEAHAEVNAIESVRDESLLRRATLYVNLEPCSHSGKTPPCAELIIRKQIPRVVAACLDPYPEVAGRGIKMLRDAGIAVETGVMEREAIRLNRFFMTAHQRHRPYIILKWAQSADGYIDRHRTDASEKPFAFSIPTTRMMMHRLRSEVQAIMVGTNTAVLDNPELTVRHWARKSPVRVLIDRQLRVPPDYRLFDGKQQTFVFTQKTGMNRENVHYFVDDSWTLKTVIDTLYKKGIHSLLVEGGAQLHRSFLNENLWDELIIETAPVLLKDGIKSPHLSSIKYAQLTDKQFFYSDSTGHEKPSVTERFLNFII